MTQTVHVDLPGRAYDVVIGPGVMDEAGARIARMGGRRHVAIVTETNVASAHLAALQASLSAAGLTSDALELPPGEATKDWANLTRTVEWLLDQKVERGDMIVALGGGVIGDLAGFAAAILRRGVRFTQVPTSLLAQVDSSVGGKTG
ncbi:MAG: iron-containing alcohol dehydrogenase, partial [Loktanella sp.]|nr:iron-containing alcohol dehydrogenase [Loktanella sp.]